MSAIEAKKESEMALWAPIFQAFEFGLWAFLPLDAVCIWCPHPTVRLDANGRLHCETGPAFELPGERVWYLKGVQVPQYVVENPKAITVGDIDTEANVEVRRIKMERFGQARYLEESGAVVVHRDDFGILYRKDIAGDEPLTMVKVVNATPEPDGSFKDYFLRVPPTMERARQAVAWTFDLTEGQYAPEVET